MFSARRHLTVGHADLPFIFVIRYVPESPHDHFRSVCSRCIDCQAVIGDDSHLRQMADSGLHKLRPFLQAKEIVGCRGGIHTYHQLIEKDQGPLHYVQMAVVKGIELAWVQGRYFQVDTPIHFTSGKNCSLT